MTTAAPEAPAAAAKKTAAGKQAPVALRPFFPGTLDLETHTKVYNLTLTAAQQPLDTYSPKTNGFLADLWIDLVASGGAGVGTLQTVNDGIFGYLASITFNDTGGQPILGPMTGHEFAMFVKWGGFSFSDDPRLSETFSEVTTSGNGACCLQIPIQFIPNQPLGPLPNTNSNNAFALDITIAASNAVFSAPPPTTAPNLVVSIYQDSYRQSSGKDAQGNATVLTPPGNGTVLYARRNSIDVASGTADIQLQQQEGSYRALHFIFKDSTGSRVQGDADWPSPVAIPFNNDVPYDRTKRKWIRELERAYGYTGTLTATANPVNGRDLGVYTLPFNTDGGMKVGDEARYRYLSVSAADTLGWRGTVLGSGTHKLISIYNFVRPAGGLIKSLTAR
ncbi:MAG TPA: hypothetical protein VGH54_15725 [Mycobacterium sp.]|jgi:hypothetical protein|uniref:hypothetical protein n=1 Tax=Mycobacterium sp. TaxID=1785 RepID=UPI002F42B782